MRRVRSLAGPMNSRSTTSSPWEDATRCAAARISSSLTAIPTYATSLSSIEGFIHQGRRLSAAVLPECLPRVVPLDWGEFLPQIKSGLWAHSSLRQPACSRQQGRTNSSAWLSYGEIEGNSSCSLIKNQAPGPPATLPVDQLESDERAS